MLLVEDKVQLPRLYLGLGYARRPSPRRRRHWTRWRIARGRQELAPVQAARLNELQVAQDVSAFEASQGLASTFQVIVGPRVAATVSRRSAVSWTRRSRSSRRRRRGASATVRFQIAPRRRSSTGSRASAGRGGKADQLNLYTSAREPRYFEGDPARYRALAPSDVQAAAARFLGRVVLVSVVPEGKKELAVPEVAR